ncbi:minor capsid protein [Anaeromicrobium sediminis]|uniref:minor capsid protein n=1 Tax=Anaeromicrobium sediminis TaxID=1478221 RepID=UPI0038BD74D8
MSIYAEIGKLLETKGYGKFNKDIKGFKKPDKPNDVVVVLPSAGGNIEHIREIGLQIIVRNKNSLESEEKANKIYEELRNLDNLNLGNFYVYSLIPTSDIIPIGFDDKDRYEYSMNFRVIRR